MHYSITTENPGPLGIAELLQRHADSLWVPDHLTADQSAAFVLDHFRRQVEAELAMVEVKVRR
jgi:hypothetical protein